MAEYSIGVDLGGTNLRAAAISADGNVIEKISGTTDLHDGREAVIADIVEGINRLKEKCASDRLAGVGIGVPGIYSYRRRRDRRVQQPARVRPFPDPR